MHSILLTADTGWLNGEHDLIALTWCGKSMDEGAPWKILTSKSGGLTLQHSKLGEWKIAYNELPNLK